MTFLRLLGWLLGGLMLTDAAISRVAFDRTPVEMVIGGGALVALLVLTSARAREWWR